jgi:hypothetical protein
MTVVRRLILVVAIATGVVCASATAASSLSLSPTDWQSSIISIAPSTEAVTVAVHNGGEVIQLTTKPGHTALIPGYRNEPYLRVTATGEVQANLKSPTWWTNKDMTGSDAIPESADPAAEPEWSTIANNGSVSWHDHRLHAMNGVPADTNWTVLVTVDDMPMVIRGQLTKLPSHGPLLELLLTIVAAAAIVTLGFRRAWTASSSALLVGAALAIIVAIGGWTATPSGFTPPRLSLLASVLAGVLAVACVVLRSSSRRLKVVSMVGAVAALAWWVALNFSSLTAVFIPNSLDAAIVRFTVGLGLGIVVGVAVTIIVSGGFTDTDVADHAVVDTGNVAGPA